MIIAYEAGNERVFVCARARLGMIDGPPNNASLDQATEALDASRRAFLKNAGKIAVYTPPAMLALSAPSFRAIAQSSGSGDQAPPSDGDDGVNRLIVWLRRRFGR